VAGTSRLSATFYQITFIITALETTYLFTSFVFIASLHKHS